MIAIIDYGAGNLRSVQNAFSHLSAPAVVVRQPEDLQRAQKIVLPGVGAFGAAMNALREHGFDEAIRDRVSQGVPLLGICLGLQLLYQESDEIGVHEGLGLLPGRVVRFPKGADLKVPHIGWNTLQFQRDHPLLMGIPDNSHVYYVHSFYVDADVADDVLATTHYGRNFVAIAQREHVMGIQCHPEKSQAVGLRLLKNFMELEVSL